ncbi:MAG: hypothetical protein GY856_40515 [bacterium]|nr:hypothetical protein [bacterium]
MGLNKHLRETIAHSSPRPQDALLAGVAACVLAGLGIARLTLGLNPHLRESLTDTLLLLLYFAAGYAVAGLIAGGLGALAVAIFRRLLRRESHRRRLALATVSVLLLGPVAYLLLLPEVGISSGLLTHALASASALRGIGYLTMTIAVLILAGWLLAVLLGLAARPFGTTVRLLVAGLWLLAAGGLLWSSFLVRPPADPAATRPDAGRLLLPPAPDPPPPRVVLLCIDGADLEIIQPMAAAGELPHFAALMHDGTWGPLATFVPTLSAVVWTTLITGKPPEEHGIHHFLHFRLPGIRRSIHKFPLHTGMNFHLFPLLEKIPGLPAMRASYTSNMRRAEALWNIVGRRYRVGAYRWLMAWPAERLNGFSVAGGIGWLQYARDLREEPGRSIRRGIVEPPDLYAGLPRPPRRPVTREALAAYVGTGEQISRRDPRLRPILQSFKDPTVHDLPLLIDRFDVRFAAANFYSIDAFHHLFNHYRNRGGIFSDAIAERYRFTDARLGELVEALGDSIQLIVVSDHGFDFERNHHTYAPAGIFFARGPAFEAGRRVTGLTVYDVAPLVLHLLEMPLPGDMPGTRSGGYRTALSRDFLSAHPAGRIATYETPQGAAHEPIGNPRDEEIKEVLRSLGYIR